MAESVRPTELLLEIRGLLGPLRATSAAVQQTLGQLPTASIAFRLKTDTFDTKDAVGKVAQLDITSAEGDKQTFIGEVESIEVQDWNQDGWAFSVRVLGGPVAAVIGRHARTFCDKSVPEIITSVLGTHQGLQVRIDRLKKSYQTRPYTVQGFESDLNFVARIAFDAGIALLFQSDGFPAKTYLIDDALEFEKHQSPMPFSARGHGTNIDLREEITRFTVRQEVTPKQYIVDAYDFKAVKKKLAAQSTGKHGPESGGNHLDLGTPYVDPGEGKLLAQRLADADGARSTTIIAESNSAFLQCGQRFDLEGHPNSTLNRTYYITASAASWTAPSDTSTATAVTGPGSNTLQLQKTPVMAVRDFSPPAKPRAGGVALAEVTGIEISGNPQKGAIAVDAYGRVRVRFKWHGLSPKAGDSDRTVPIRVVQGWAGEKRGFHLLPRVGDEVVVAFEENDPERPIIVGSLFNEHNTPATLPDEAAHMVIRSRSLPGGKAQNFNELRFDDANGRERVFLQAEKDLEEQIKNNAKIDIGGRGDVSAKVAYTIEVGGASLEIKPDSVKLQLGAAQLSFDAAGQVVLNGQIIRIG